MFFGPATRWDIGMECHQGKETVVPSSGHGWKRVCKTLGKPSSKEDAGLILSRVWKLPRVLLEQLASWIHPAGYKLNIHI